MNEYLKKGTPPFVYLCEVLPSSEGSSIPSNRWSYSAIGYLTKRKGKIDGPYKMTYSAKGIVSEPPGFVEVIYTVEKTAKLKWGCSVGRTFGNIPPFGEIHDIFFVICQAFIFQT